MTIVDDMSTTRKAARYKGSRPLAKEKPFYADLVIMPTPPRIAVSGRESALIRSA
jgi:hypothetical protein